MFAGNILEIVSMYGGIRSFGSQDWLRFLRQEINFPYEISWLTALRSAMSMLVTLMVLLQEFIIFTMAKS
jgi:hypothetical protein